MQSNAKIHWYKQVYTSICKCTSIYTSVQSTKLIYLSMLRYICEWDLEWEYALERGTARARNSKWL